MTEPCIKCEQVLVDRDGGFLLCHDCVQAYWRELASRRENPEHYASASWGLSKWFDETLEDA